MKPMVLFVDDDEMMRELVSYQLSDAGYNVLTAEDGKEGLKFFRHYKPQMVISDINMPEMDGIQLLKMIREISKETKIIIVSASDSFETAVKVMKMGACDYLEKPFSLEVLVNSVEEILNNKVQAANGI